MLLKHVPDGACASDLARMLPPRWGYQGIAGPGDGFWLILSGWKSTCASQRRGQRVCLCKGLVHRRNFLLAQRENKKLGVFPSILEENPCFPGNRSHLGKTAAAFSQKKSPNSLIFFPIYTNIFCFLPLRQVSDYDPASIMP